MIPFGSITKSARADSPLRSVKTPYVREMAPLGSKSERRGKFQMTPDSVDGDSEEFGFEFPELRHQLRIQSQLVAADGAPIRGIETKHHGPAEKIPERDMLIRGRLEGEVRRLGAGLQRRDLLVFRLELSHPNV